MNERLRGVEMTRTHAYVITEPYRGNIQGFDVLDLSSEDVLVKVQACGVCTTDRRLFAGKLKVAYPVIGGHEVSGEVVRVGRDVKNVAPGMRVALDTIFRCGSCYYCRKGLDHLCLYSRKGAKIGDAVLIAGGFSEYITVKQAQVFSMADTVDFVEAAMSEPFACCLHSFQKAHLSSGDSVLIIGAGTMGLLHAMTAQLNGVASLISDSDAARRDFANQLGYRTVEPSMVIEAKQRNNEGLGFDAVFITAPVLSLINDSLSLVRKGGTIVIYTSLHPSGNVVFDANQMHYTEVVITGTEGRTKEDFRKATALISNASVDLKPLVTKHIRLGDLSEELSNVPSGNSQRTIITF